jgi:CBS-domain-containing membrane protein
MKFCAPEDDLAAAAAILWECDCGAVPVLDGDGKLLGVITDRDICMAVATRKRLASEIPVREVMSGNLSSCQVGASVKEALHLMREAEIGRLPILDENGHFKGIVTLSDILTAVRDMRPQAAKEALLQELMMTLMATSQRRQPHAMQLAGVRAMVPGA